MEVAMEIEDDSFFQDLSKQISLLIMDDDEEDTVVAQYPSVSLQAFSRAIHPTHDHVQPAYSYESYDQNCRRESKGTGVFIPRSAHPRRKNRQGSRFTSTAAASSNSKYQSQRQQRNMPENTRSVLPLPRVSYNNINPKRF